MKTVQRTFKFSPVATAIALALAAQFPANVAYANAGFGDSVNMANTPVKVRTYNANSPSGPAPVLDPVTGLTIPAAITQLPTKNSTGKALRKFVDTLPGIGAAKANNLGQYLPVAVPEKWVDLNGTITADDYLEIAAVEYTQKMHSDLVKPTRLRGYVQLMTPGLLAMGKVAKSFTMPDGRVLSVVDLPHHLGPIIQATSGTALRVKFVNLLPVSLTGTDSGKLFVPVDTTVVGAGNGADGLTPYSQNRVVMHLVAGGLPWISAGNPHQWIAPAGETNPGVDALGAHKAVVDARGVGNHNVPDMADPGPGATTLYFPNDISARFTFYHDRTSGLTRLNAYAGMEAGYFVTDAAEQALIAGGTLSGGALTTSVTLAAGVIPGPADTIPLIIEDKTFVAADIAQQDAKWNKKLDGVTTVTTWGQPGDLWFPHVYEPNQDPTSAMGINSVGRFDYGPLFWPIFPAFDATPTGSVDDPTIVPEAYLDTPVINGTAYPTITVDPKAYRFRILNASGDRYLNLGLYKADMTPGLAPMLDDNGNPIFNAAGVQQFFTGTEVKLVDALAADALGNPPVPNNSDGTTPNTVARYSAAGVAYDAACMCQYPTLDSNVKAEASGAVRAWPIDARRGGVPDPLSVGPDIIAIGNDGGFLPNPVDIPSQPIAYEANRRSITVNNAYGYGLLLGPSERSDAIIDFSQYAGQTLIVYNDAPAPFPFTDERNDYYTGNPDLSGVGGAYATKPGYGPNTRTIMQIKVKAEAAGVPGRNGRPGVPPVVAAAPYNPAALKAALPAAYAATQPAPLVPAVAYNKAFGTNDPDIYAHIATGAGAQSTLDFTTTSGAIELTGLDLITAGGVVDPNALAGPGGAPTGMIYNTGSGSGYNPLSPPKVVFNNVVNGVNCLSAGGTSASATVTVNTTTRQVNPINPAVDPLTSFSPGSGYVCAPTVSFINTAPVTSVAVVDGGSGYTLAPTITIAGGGGTGATATATVANGAITAIIVNLKGSGYTSIPTLTITPAVGDTPVRAAVANAVLAPSLGVGAQVAVKSTGAFRSLPVRPLAEQELFDNRGRYNKTGGVEMPFSNAVNQTTVPLNYIDAATETIADGATEVWKITVNGLFSNNLTFSLADVQLLNRVGWDGTVKPPSSNELGWKTTVRMNPLEDVVVAIRAKRAKVPFGMPQSARLQDPSKPLGAKGSEMGFTVGQNVPELGLAAINRAMNYDNEFYWGSTLLSNSETDFMRPVVFNPTVAVPAAPSNLNALGGNSTLSWTDPTPAGQLAQAGSVTPPVPAIAATLANPQNEIGFRIYADGNTTTPVAVLPANVTTWTDATKYSTASSYTVVAYNAAGESPASNPFTQGIPVAPTSFSADFTASTTDAPTLVNFYNSVTLNWSGNTTSNQLVVLRDGVPITSLPGSATSYTDTTTALSTYVYQINAVSGTNTASSAPLTVTTPMIPVTAPAAVTATSNINGTAITVRWTDTANNETRYDVAVSEDGGSTFTPVGSVTRTAAQGTATSATANVTLAPNFVSTPGKKYVFGVKAVNVTGIATSTSTQTLSPEVDLTVPAPAVPVVTTVGQTATRLSLSWPAVAVPGAAITYVVQVNTNGAGFVDMAASNRLTATVNLVAGNTYQVQVLARATRFGLTTVGLASAPMTVITAPRASTAVVATAGVAGSKAITLNWSNTSSSVTSWTVQRRPNFGANNLRVYSPITVTVNGTAPAYSFTDTVPALGSYTYRINAVNATGSGPVATSNAVTAR